MQQGIGYDHNENTQPRCQTLETEHAKVAVKKLNCEKLREIDGLVEQQVVKAAGLKPRIELVKAAGAAGYSEHGQHDGMMRVVQAHV